MTLISDIQEVLDATRIEAGFSLWHIETGEQLEINGSQPFPMASVFKIPILATAGKQLEQGKISLDDRVTLNEADKSVGSGILQFFQAGLNPTLRDLLTLMIIISDNTATDMSVDLLGGCDVVETTMHALGLNDIFFSMNCKQLLKTLYPPEIRDLPVDQIRAWARENDILRDAAALSRGPDNNVSSANSMTRLVQMLFTGQIVDGAVKDALIDILLRQQLNQRLPRLLPSNVQFAHKTGTIGGFCNDSGVMYVDEQQRVAVTLFTRWNEEDYWQQPEARTDRLFEVETAMGKIGRLVYEHYAAQA